MAELCHNFLHKWRSFFADCVHCRRQYIQSAAGDRVHVLARQPEVRGEVMALKLIIAIKWPLMSDAGMTCYGRWADGELLLLWGKVF